MNLRPQRKESPEIGLAPLIDVVFLLLIFFMVSTTFDQESRFNLQLLEASREAENPPPEQAIEIVITRDGSITLAGQALINPTLEEMVAHLERVAAGDYSRQVTIRADGETPHQEVVRAMDAASRAGLLRIAIPTRLQRE